MEGARTKTLNLLPQTPASTEVRSSADPSAGGMPPLAAGDAEAMAQLVQEMGVGVGYNGINSGTKHVGVLSCAPARWHRRKRDVRKVRRGMEGEAALDRPKLQQQQGLVMNGTVVGVGVASESLGCSRCVLAS